MEEYSVCPHCLLGNYIPNPEAGGGVPLYLCTNRECLKEFDIPKIVKPVAKEE